MDSMPDPMFNVNNLGSHDSASSSSPTPVTDVKPVPINLDPAMAPVGVRVTMVGYRRDRSRRRRQRRHRVRRPADVDRVRPAGRRSDANLLCFNQTSGKGKCEGDSGGPSFATINGKLLEVGITSFGDQNCAQFGADTRVDAEKAFIMQHVPKLYCETDADCPMGRMCFENACIVTPFQPTGLGSACTGNADCDSARARGRQGRASAA